MVTEKYGKQLPSDPKVYERGKLDFYVIKVNSGGRHSPVYLCVSHLWQFVFYRCNKVLVSLDLVRTFFLLKIGLYVSYLNSQKS